MTRNQMDNLAMLEGYYAGAAQKMLDAKETFTQDSLTEEKAHEAAVKIRDAIFCLCCALAMFDVTELDAKFDCPGQEQVGRMRLRLKRLK